MRDVWIIGAHSTAFAKRPDRSFKHLTRETYLGVLADAGLADRATTISDGLVRELPHAHLRAGWHPRSGEHGRARGRRPCSRCRVPIINVEGACATASMALHGAVKDIRSGDAEVSLALGRGEDLSARRRARSCRAGRDVRVPHRSGFDNFDQPRLVAEYEKAAAFAGCTFEVGPGRTMFMDTYAVTGRGPHAPATARRRPRSPRARPRTTTTGR